MKFFDNLIGWTLNRNRVYSSIPLTLMVLCWHGRQIVNQSEEKAFKLYLEPKKILKEDAFNLRKFCTIDCQLQSKIYTVEETSSTDKDSLMLPQSQKCSQR